MPLVSVAVQGRHENPRPLPMQHLPDRAVDSLYHLPRPDDKLERQSPVLTGTLYNTGVTTAVVSAAATTAYCVGAAASSAAPATAATAAFLQRASVVNAHDVANIGPPAFLLSLKYDLAFVVTDEEVVDKSCGSRQSGSQGRGERRGRVSPRYCKQSPRATI